MKLWLCGMLLLLDPVLPAQEQPADPLSKARLDSEERQKVVTLLLDSRKDMLEAIENLSEAQWRYKPSPLKWSVGEVAEHILLTEAALYSSMEKALAAPANPDWEARTRGKTEFLERVMVSRDRRAQAPVEVRPSNKLSRQEVLSRYREAREKTIRFARETGLPLKAHTYDHPFPVFNTLSAYQWLIYIPLHNLRHNKQIAEVKASPGFPKD